MQFRTWHLPSGFKPSSRKNKKTPFHGSSYENIDVTPKAPLLDRTSPTGFDDASFKKEKISKTLSRRMSAWKLTNKSADAVEKSNSSNDQNRTGRKSSVQLTLIDFHDAAPKCEVRKSLDEGSRESAARWYTGNEPLPQSSPMQPSFQWVPLHSEKSVKRVMRRVSTWFRPDADGRKHKQDKLRDDRIRTEAQQKCRRNRSLSFHDGSREKIIMSMMPPVQARGCKSEDGGSRANMADFLINLNSTDERGSPMLALKTPREVRRQETLKNARLTTSTANKRASRIEAARRSRTSTDSKIDAGFISFLNSGGKRALPPVPVIPSAYHPDGSADVSWPVKPCSLPPCPSAVRMAAIAERPIRPPLSRNHSHTYAWDHTRDGWVLITRDKDGDIVWEEFVGKYAI
ncbi:hypothetical protein DFJ77DRAFT_447415 [Powellomyces hirtus]|nr:hypothetical protein DFJ77DRAFT_447415 [Powellomyces hirtus]